MRLRPGPRSCLHRRELSPCVTQLPRKRRVRRHLPCRDGGAGSFPLCGESGVEFGNAGVTRRVACKEFPRVSGAQAACGAIPSGPGPAIWALSCQGRLVRHGLWVQRPHVRNAVDAPGRTLLGLCGATPASGKGGRELKAGTRGTAAEGARGPGRTSGGGARWHVGDAGHGRRHVGHVGGRSLWHSGAPVCGGG